MPLYTGEGIVIEPGSIRSGSLAIDPSQVGAVWVGQVSQLRGLILVASFGALMFGGTMMSCAGLLIGAMSEEENWFLKACLITGGGFLGLFLANRVPPYKFLVCANVQGQSVVVYTTPDRGQADEIARTIPLAKR